MTEYAVLAEDLYLNVNMPGRTKISQLKELADICDVTVSFENWPDYSRNR